MQDLESRTKNAERGSTKKHSAEKQGRRIEPSTKNWQRYTQLDFRKAMKH